jgi:hypothetical protein
LPSRNGRCVDSVADTSDASSDDELRGGATIGRYTGDLDDYTNNHDESSDEDRVATTEFVADEEDGYRTQEATTSVDRDDETFVGRIAFNLGKGLLKRGGGDDTTHHTLVVTKEQEVGNSNHGNENLKHPSGLPPVGGDTGVVVLYARHGGGYSIQLKAGERCWGIISGETVCL